MANEVQNIAVDVLKVHPRNQEFFDDISGQTRELQEIIADEGIISGNYRCARYDNHIRTSKI